MSLKPISAQMQFVNGTVQPPENIPGLYAQQAANYAARGRERDVIFLHLTLAGQLEESLALLNDLKLAFVHTYHTSQGSITSALRSAIQATNAHLVAQNRAGNQNRVGSLSVAIFRDDELFIGQVGEAYAYIARSFGLEPLPPERPDEMTPLGQQGGLDIRFFHNRLQSGDLLVLLDPRVAHLSTQKYVTSLVGQSVTSAMASLTEQLNAHTGRLLLVEFTEDASRPIYFSKEQIRRGPQAATSAEAATVLPALDMAPVRGRDDEARSEALYQRRKMLEEQARALAEKPDAVEPDEPAAFEPVDDLPEAEPQAAMFEGIRPNPAPFKSEHVDDDQLTDEASEAPEEQSFIELAANAAPERPVRTQSVLPVEAKTALEEPTLEELTASFELDETASLVEAPTSPTIPKRMETAAPVREAEAEPQRVVSAETTSASTGIEKASRRAASGVLGAASRFLRWLASLLTQFRQPNAKDLDAPRGERLWATMLSIVIPIVVGLVVSGVYLQSRERNEIATIQRNLTLTLNEAITLETEQRNLDAARIRYLDVIAIADAADNRIDDNPDIVLSKQIAREAIDRLDGVVRLQARTLYRYDQGVALSSIEVGVDSTAQNHVYVLDATANFVDDHRADQSLQTFVGEPTRLVRQGQGVQRHIVGNLLDIEWKPITANNSESLVMLDREGTAISHFPATDDTISSPLGLAGEWQSPTVLMSYIGRIYVLDQGNELVAGQAWRYLPDGRNFTINEEAKSLVLPDLANAADILVDPEDASVLVLYRDGRISRYLNERLVWDESALALNGLSEPLISPVAIKLGGSGTRSSYYVLDPGSNRIVEISRPGKLLNQFRLDLDDGSTDILRDATDFYVTQSTRSFFITVDNVIAVAER